MATDLATVATQVPAHLQKIQTTTIDEFGGGIGESFPLPFLSVRGKEFRLRKDGQELNTRLRELQVVLVAARPTTSKRYYEGQYSAGSMDAPDCSSHDSKTPDVTAPVHPNCTHCPKNQWGSRITENGKEGKACQDYKRLVVLPLIEGVGDQPLVLDVAATSLKAPKDQKHHVLMLRDYLTQLQKHQMDPTTVVTTIQFTDAEYPQLCFDFNRYITKEEYVTVQELRESDDVRSVLDQDMFEPEGTITEAEGTITEAESDPTPAATKKRSTTTQSKKKAAPAKQEPATEKPAEPGPETPTEGKAEPGIPPYPGKTVAMKDDDGDVIIAEDEDTWAEAYEQGYRPVESKKKASASKKAAPQKTTQPEPEPTPEAGSAEDADDNGEGEGDLLAEVTKLLGS